MDLIQHPLDLSAADLALLTRVPIAVARLDLEKRRWRGLGADGREFGFDLDHPLHDGAVVCATTSHAYVIAQAPEPVLEIALGDAETSARLGWKIGNLHFPIEITPTAVRVTDDPALRQMLEREQIPFVEKTAVFQPLKGLPHAHH